MFYKVFWLVLITILLVISSCEDKKEDACNNDPYLIIDCIGFPDLGFIITRNGENIFNLDTITIQDVKLLGDDATNGELRLESELSSTEGPVLFFLDTDWNDGSEHNYIMTVEDNDSFSLNTSFTLSKGPCCGGIPILEKIQINDNEAVIDSETGFYIISLD